MEKKEKVETLPAVQEQALPATTRSIFLDIQRFEEAKQIAKMLSDSSMLPKHFQQSVPNCMILLNLADRMRIDPFMLAQNMYIVYNKPGIESKLLIALIEGHGKFGPLKFKFTESGKVTSKKVKRPDSCLAYATELKTGEVIEGPTVTWELVEAEGWSKKDGSKWETMPEMMFMYRASAFFGRVYDPGAILGLRTAEELDEIIELKEVAPGQYAVPGKEPEPMNEQEISDTWNASIPPDTDTGLLIEFLELSAEKNKKTIAEIKSAVASDPKEIKSFWRIFKGWAEKREKKPAPKKETTKEKETVEYPAEEKPKEPEPSPSDTSPEPQPEKETPQEGEGNGGKIPKRGLIKAQVQKLCMEMGGDDIAEVSKVFYSITGFKTFAEVPDEQLNPVKVRVQMKYDLWKAERAKGGK